MTFAQDFIDRVREATNIIPVISQYVQLRRSGSNHQGLCPFHNEKTPSFSVSEDKQVFYCFGCKTGGNVFGFVQKYQGLTFPEAVEYLARRATIPIPSGGGRDSTRDSKTTFFKINSLTAQFYHQHLKELPESHPVKKYIAERGLTDSLVDRYKIGFAPDGWSDLEQYFVSRQVPVTSAEQLGLIKRRPQEKNGHYDLFRNRLMFPIYSPTGNCLGFGGRVLSSDQQPKYLNSPDSPIFHKGKVFYGLDQSAKFIRTADEAIVVEGYMDWLALVKVDISHVAATLGTALTSDHARLIKRYTNKVLLLFDGDAAGKSAARRSLPILLSEGLLARGLFLPDELDPDEYIKKHGAPALKALIHAAPDLFELISGEQWMLAKGSPSGKIQLLDEFAPVLGQIPDRRLRQLYSETFANMVGVDLKLVEQSLVRAVVQAPKPRAQEQRSVSPTILPPASRPPVFDLTKAPRAEIEILNLMLLQEVYLKETLNSQVGESMSHPGCKAVFHRIAEVYGQMPNKFDTLSALLADEVKPVETITRHLCEPYLSLAPDAAKKLLQDCIKRVKSDLLKSKSKELVSSLRGTSEANPSEQLEQIMNIHKNRRSLNRDS